MLVLGIETSCDETAAAIVREGREIVSGSPEELARRYWQGSRLVVDAEDRGSLEMIREFEGVVGLEMNGHAVVQLDSLERVPDLVAWLTKKGVRLTRVEPRVPTLEDMYFAAYRERPR